MLNLALFDLDDTLIPIDSDHAWGDFTTHLGWTDADSFKRQNDAFFRRYATGALDIREYVRFATAALREHGPVAAAAAQARFLAEVVEPVITPQALALLQAHRAAGDTLAIVTSTNEWVTRPIAVRLGVGELIAIRLRRDAHGWITGEIDGTPSFREGKVTRVAEWLRMRGLGWTDARITFYSDSINDLPLMLRAQQPVATNPDTRLRAIALARGWRILELLDSIS
jgi:HAD superfamily hydrolase (TIGR01490 family)